MRQFELRLSEDVQMINGFIERKTEVFKELHESLLIRRFALDNIESMKVAERWDKTKVKVKFQTEQLTFADRNVDLEISTSKYGDSRVAYSEILGYSNKNIAAFSQELNETHVYKDEKLVHKESRRLNAFAVFNDFLVCDHDIYRYDIFNDVYSKCQTLTQIPTTALALSNNEAVVIGLNNNTRFEFYVVEDDKLKRKANHRARSQHVHKINVGIEKIKEFPQFGQSYIYTLFEGRLQRYDLDELRNYKRQRYEKSPNTTLQFKRATSDFNQVDKDHLALLLGGH